MFLMGSGLGLRVAEARVSGDTMSSDQDLSWRFGLEVARLPDLSLKIDLT